MQTFTIPTSEITNIVYDTLMNNSQHEQFDTQYVEDQECDAANACISFRYGNKSFEIRIFEKSN